MGELVYDRPPPPPATPPRTPQAKNQRLDLEGRIRDMTECVDKLDELLQDEQMGEAELRKVRSVQTRRTSTRNSDAFHSRPL